MNFGWSKHQERSLHEPTAYGLNVVVEKPLGQGRRQIARDPVPELLWGDPQLFQSAATRLPFKLAYRSGTLSWALKEFDAHAFNEGDPELRGQIAAIVEMVEQLLHAGVPSAARLPFWAGTHTHTKRMELNFAFPRGVITPVGKVRSFNPHPPTKGSTADLDAVCDRIIAAFGYANPRDPARRAWICGSDWAEKELAEMARYDVGATQDRPVLWLLDALKREAKGYKDVDDLLISAAPLRNQVEFEVLKRDRRKLKLGPKENEGLTLRGSLIDGGPTVSDFQRYEFDMARTKERLAAAWQKRAAYNAHRYGFIPVPEPDLSRILAEPSLKIPERHAGRPYTANHKGPISQLTEKITTRMALALSQVIAFAPLAPRFQKLQHSAHSLTQKLKALHVPVSYPNTVSHRPTERGSDRTPYHASVGDARESADCGHAGGDRKLRDHAGRNDGRDGSCDWRFTTDPTGGRGDRTAEGANGSAGEHDDADERTDNEAPRRDVRAGRPWIAAWRVLRSALIEAFPDRTISVLPLLSMSDLAFRVRLGEKAYLVDTKGIFAGPENADLARIVGEVVNLISGVDDTCKNAPDEGPAPF